MLHSFVIKSKLSLQVGFWRFKMMAMPGKETKKQRIHKYRRLIELLEILERKATPAHYRRFFYCCSALMASNLASKEVKILGNFLDLLDTNMINSVKTLKCDSMALNGSTVMRKLAKN